MSETTYVHERIELPSKGLIYPESSPLSKGYVDVKYLTALEEDILTNQNYIAQDIVIDKLFESMIVTPGANFKDMIAGDINALYYACRILSYGTEYQFNSVHPVTREPDIATADLSGITNKEIDESLFKNRINEFDFKLPHSKLNIKFKLLTRKDRDELKIEEKSYKKLFPLKSYTQALFLIYSIVEIDGKRDKSFIRKFIDDGIMLSLDSYKLKEYISKLQPDVNTNVDITYSDGYVEKDGSADIQVSFWWPSAL